MNKLLSGLSALVLATLPGCVSLPTGTPEYTPPHQIVKEDCTPETKDTSKPKLTGSASTAIKTKQIAPFGIAFGSGPSQTGFVNLNYGNFSAFTWALYDHTDNKMHEADLGISYAKPITNDLTASVSAQLWNYPEEMLPNSDVMLEAALTHTGIVDINAKYRHVLDSNNGYESGNMGLLSASKTIPLSEKVAIAPSISTAYLEYWYGFKGLTQITPGFDLTIKTGEDSYLKGTARQQFGFEEMDNVTYFGLETGISF